MTEFSGRVYPNGEFTVGAVPRKLKPKDILPVKTQDSPHVDARVYSLRTFGLEPALAVCEGEAPLGLSSVPISHNRAPKGLKGISGHGRRMVRNGCHLLEGRFGKGRCGFATFTLPKLNIQDYAAVCYQWGDIVRLLIQTLKRRLTTRTESPYLVYVTELQTKRFNHEGRYYPHLHICYPARPQRSYDWYISASDMRNIWESIINSRCLSRYSFNASVDCVVVKKSLGAYLSKYISKGEGNVRGALEAGLPLGCIGHWWGITGELRRAIRKGTCACPIVAEYLWRAAPRLAQAGVIRWVRYVYIQTHLAGERCVGMSGVLDGSYLEVLKQKGRIELTVP